MSKHKRRKKDHPLRNIQNACKHVRDSYERELKNSEISDNLSDDEYGKTIAEKCKHHHTAVNSVITKAKYKNQFNLAAEQSCRKKRLDAVVKYAFEYARPLHKKYPHAEDMYSRLCFMSPMSRVIEPFVNHRLLATALYILDLLSINGTIEDALIYLSYYKTDKYENRNLAVTDCNHESSVIDAMVELIKLRNNTDNEKQGGFVTPEAVDYMLRNQNRQFEYVESSFDIDADITGDEEQKANNRKIAVEIKQKADKMTNRERMDAIISLLPEDAVETCIDKFIKATKDMYNNIIEVTDNHMKILRNLKKDCIKSYDELIEYTDSIIAYETNFSNETEKNNKKVEKPVPQMPLAVFNNAAMTNAMKGIDSPRIISSVGGYASVKDDDARHAEFMRKYEEHKKGVETIIDKTNEMGERITSIEENMDEFINDQFYIKRYYDEISVNPMTVGTHQFDFANPYELIFGYFMLLETGHDLVWLSSICEMLVAKCLYKLPWFETVNKHVSEHIGDDIVIKASTEASDYWNNDKNYKKLYDLNYNDSVMHSLAGIDRISKKNLKRMNFPQLMYCLSREIMPRDMDMPESLIKGLKKSGIASKNIIEVQNYVNVLKSSRVKTSFEDLRKYDIEDTDLSSASETEDIDELRKSIRHLEQQLYASNRKVANLQNERDEAQNEHEFEKNELNTLRELIYDLQNKQDIDNSQSESEDIELPYDVKGKVVIFGGHESWLREIKPLLNNVRFMNPYDKPNETLIRNCDEVWMQTNAMPHSFYAKIMNITRTQKIPVQYFRFASAKKDALQLAKHNMENFD